MQDGVLAQVRRRQVQVNQLFVPSQEAEKLRLDLCFCAEHFGHVVA